MLLRLLDVPLVRDAKSQLAASLRSEKLLDVLISLAMRRHLGLVSDTLLNACHSLHVGIF